MATGKSDTKEKLLKAAAYLEHGFIKAKHTVKEKFHMLDPVMIMPYYGYGNDTCVYLKGRVVSTKPMLHLMSKNINIAKSAISRTHPGYLHPRCI